MKKLLALCLTVIMVFSMFSVAVSAATINVASKTLIDQSFTGDAVPTGWTATVNNGTINFTGSAMTFIPGSADSNKHLDVLKTEKYNAGASDYTLTVKASHYDGISYLHFGAATPAEAIAREVSSTGYTLVMTHASYTKGSYTLYLNGTEMGTVADNGNDYAYQNLRDFKFDVTSTGVTVNVGGADASTTLTNPTGVATNYAGYFGFSMGNNTGDNSTASKKPTSLASVNLATVASSYDITVTEPTTDGYVLSEIKPIDQKFFDDSTGTAVALTAIPDGWVNVSTNAPTFNTKGLYWASKKYEGVKTASSIDFGSANYEVEWTFINGQNNFWIYIGAESIPLTSGGKASTTGYCVHFKGGSAIELYKDGVLKNSGGSYSASTTIIKAMKLVVKDGVTALYYKAGSSTTVPTPAYVFEIEDATPPTSGLVGAYGSYAKTTLRSVKMTSSTQKASFLLDKKFSSATDTLASLDADGFDLEYIDSVGANGLVGNSAKHHKVTFAANKFGGVYTTEVEAVVQNNPAHVRVNVSEDGASYYDIYNDKDNTTLKIDKVTADGTTTLNSKNVGATYLGASQTLKYVVTLAPQDTGDMKIDVAVYLNGTAADTLSATDAAASTPLTNGYVQYLGAYSASTIKSMKVYPGATLTPYTGNFYVNGTASASKGHTIMTFPVSMIGQTPDVIAALYEDGKVTDVEFINIEDLNNNGYAELFDTASSTANTVNVKVFIWDTLEGLIPVTEAFSLVK